MTENNRIEDLSRSLEEIINAAEFEGVDYTDVLVPPAERDRIAHEADREIEEHERNIAEGADPEDWKYAGLRPDASMIRAMKISETYWKTYGGDSIISVEWDSGIMPKGD